MRRWNPRPVYPPDSATALFYYPDLNRFADEDGTIMHDLSDRFAVWELEEWKKTREYGILQDRNGELCELFYPEDDVDYPVNTLLISKQVRHALGY